MVSRVAGELARDIAGLILRRLGIENGESHGWVKPAAPAARRRGRPPSSAAAANGAKPARAAKRGGKRTRASSDEMSDRVDRVARVIDPSDGVSSSEIEKKAKLSRNLVQAAIRTLREQGRIFMGGTKRSRALRVVLQKQGRRGERRRTRLVSEAVRRRTSGPLSAPRRRRQARSRRPRRVRRRADRCWRDRPRGTDPCARHGAEHRSRRRGSLDRAAPAGSASAAVARTLSNAPPRSHGRALEIRRPWRDRRLALRLVLARGDAHRDRQHHHPRAETANTFYPSFPSSTEAPQGPGRRECVLAGQWPRGERRSLARPLVDSGFDVRRL